MKAEIVLPIYLFVEFFILLFFEKFLIYFLKEKNLVQHVREELIESHKKKEGTPRGGGIVFLISTIFILPLIFTLKIPYHVLRQLFFVFFSTVLFGLIGLIDDVLTSRKSSSEGLSIRSKLILFSLATIVLFATFKDIMTFNVMFLGSNFNVGPFLYFILFFVIMVGSVNAFNLTDGVDGLLGSVGSIILITFIVLSYLTKNLPLLFFTLSLLISILVFLWFNSPKASIFMGDLGASALGGAIASLSIVFKTELYLPFIAIIPVIEAISIFIQIAYFKATHGKRVFKMTPIHHHFEILGWSEAKIDFRFSIITAFMVILIIVLKIIGL
ncbi:phospho-N-acetylmuramoyl-pentapeptide-transferase [Caldisericum exile AZM16c01]|uniref:Phospho-N-acetylmuramoyl-pentapeptide-transferase n=2 Tax=Caldisericum exile TaxID=693075 RepID=A0A7U6GF86_CALEA|nr:phospho-N-acetylmuramoyl-pentapeptide-transferase [Caldisericum exile AZM16c01]